MPGNPPVSSAIHVGFPSASKASANGAAKAAAETAEAPLAATCAVPDNGTSSRSNDASIQSTTKALDLTPACSTPFTESTFMPLETSEAGTDTSASTDSWPSKVAAPTVVPLNRNSDRWSGSFVALDQPITRTFSDTSPAAPVRSIGKSFREAALVPAMT